MENLQLWEAVLIALGMVGSIIGLIIRTESRFSKMESKVDNNEKDILRNGKLIDHLTDRDHELGTQVNHSMLELRGTISELTTFIKEQMAILTTKFDNMEERTKKLEDK